MAKKYHFKGKNAANAKIALNWSFLVILAFKNHGSTLCDDKIHK